MSSTRISLVHRHPEGDQFRHMRSRAGPDGEGALIRIWLPSPRLPSITHVLFTDEGSMPSGSGKLGSQRPQK